MRPLWRKKKQLKKERFCPSSIAFEMPDRWGIFPASSSPRPDFGRNGVSLAQFYLLSARLDQDDVAYAEAKLPQTTTTTTTTTSTSTTTTTT